MSFLPYASPAPGAWLGSLGFSAVAHAGMASVLAFSGAVTFLPSDTDLEVPETAVLTSFRDFLETEQVQEFDFTDVAIAPEESVELQPVELDSYDSGYTPDLPDAPPAEELEVAEPEPVEPPAEELEVAEPEPVEPPAIVEDPLDANPFDEGGGAILEATELDAPETIDVLTPEPEPVPLVAEPVIEEPAIVEEPQILEVPDTPIIAEAITGEPLDPFASEGGGGGGLIAEPVEGVADLLDLGAEDATILSTEPPAEPDPPVETVTVETPDEPEPDPAAGIEAQEDEILAGLPDAGETGTIINDGGQAAQVVEEDVQDVEVLEDGGAGETQTLGRPVVQNPTVQDVAIGVLIRRIRELGNEGCTLALPRRVAGSTTGGLAMIGDDLATLDLVAGRVTVGNDQQPNGSLPVQTREIVDARQCAALDAIRQSADYPVSRIGLALDNAQLRSGDTLTARVLGAGGLFLTLLVVDDNGVVQDLAPFTQLEGDTPVISVPVARSGPTRATRQMMLALGTTAAPLNLQGFIGETAQDVFSNIPAEQLESLVFAVATFDVR